MYLRPRTSQDGRGGLFRVASPHLFTGQTLAGFCLVKDTHALPESIAALGVAPKILTDPDAWFNTVRFAKER